VDCEQFTNPTPIKPTVCFEHKDEYGGMIANPSPLKEPFAMKQVHSSFYRVFNP
jgi:hypothetical protein